MTQLAELPRADAGAEVICAGVVHDVILAEEPASALDPHWRQVVLDLLLAEARRGAVVVIASNDPDITAACDELVAIR